MQKKAEDSEKQKKKEIEEQGSQPLDMGLLAGMNANALVTYGMPQGIPQGMGSNMNINMGNMGSMGYNQMDMGMNSGFGGSMPFGSQNGYNKY